MQKKASFSSICRNVLILGQKPTICFTKTYNGLPLACFLASRVQIIGFVIKIVFTLTLELTCITFIIYFILKLFIFINVFTQNLAKFFSNVLYTLFRILSIFIFYCFVFVAIVLLICILVNLLRIFRNIVNLFYILFSCSVSVNSNVDKDITHTVRLQSNTNSLELWIFPVTFLFLMVWCKQKSDKNVKNFLLLLKCMNFLFLKNKNSSDLFNDVKNCTRSEFFMSEFMNICEDFQFLVTRINSAFDSVSKLEYRNFNSYFHLLILLSGYISLF